jgi:hypothetical protein
VPSAGRVLSSSSSVFSSSTLSTESFSAEPPSPEPEPDLSSLALSSPASVCSIYMGYQATGVNQYE